MAPPEAKLGWRRSVAEPEGQLGVAIVSGAGGRYPSELCGRLVLYNKGWERPRYRVSGTAVPLASVVRSSDRHS